MLFTIPLAFAMHQPTHNAVVEHDHNGSNIYEVVEDLQSMPEFGSGLPCFRYVSMALASDSRAVILQYDSAEITRRNRNRHF